MSVRVQFTTNPIESCAGIVAYVQEVTIPNEGADPRIAQKTSEFWVAEAVMRSPFARTTSAETTVSTRRPNLRDARPNPPKEVCPPEPDHVNKPRIRKSRGNARAYQRKGKYHEVNLFFQRYISP